jgi:branched-chain amino acid transport system ATP-binding protein
VTVRFGGVVALDHVSLELLEGELVALIGPNGAGKTTLFNVLSGIQRPNTGSISYARQPIDQLDPSARARLGIGRTFQTAQAFGSLTVLDNLLLPAWLPRPGGMLTDLISLPGVGRARQAALDRARGVATFLGIEDTLERFPRELSLGQRRLVELARALAAEPRLLMLDEPASGLDATETARFAQLLLRVRDVFRLTMLLVEHDMQLVLAVADHLYVLNFGKMLARGEPAEVVRDPAVVTAYLGGQSNDGAPAPQGDDRTGDIAETPTLPFGEAGAGSFGREGWLL